MCKASTSFMHAWVKEWCSNVTCACCNDTYMPLASMQYNTRACICIHNASLHSMIVIIHHAMHSSMHACSRLKYCNSLCMCVCFLQLSLERIPVQSGVSLPSSSALWLHGCPCPCGDTNCAPTTDTHWEGPKYIN